MTPNEAKTIMEFVVGFIERETATTRKVLACMPENPDYKPSERCMAALDLAWHIATSEQAFMSGLAAGTFEGMGAGTRPESIKTGADVAAWYAEQSATNIAKLKAMSGEDCVRVIDFHGMFQLPAVSYAQFSLVHAVHHRGQLSSYLRPMGGKVPSIYGPSGDEDIRAAKGA